MGWLAMLLRQLACAVAGHPGKRIRYWMVKAEPNGAYSAGWSGNPLGSSRNEPQRGPAFAVVDFECPDCERRWFTELS